MKFNNLLTFAVAAITANAQNINTTTSGVPPGTTNSTRLTPCAFNCISKTAFDNGCSGPSGISIADLPCLCTNQAYLMAARNCLNSNCSSAELQASREMKQRLCVNWTSSTTAYNSASSTPLDSTGQNGGSNSRQSAKVNAASSMRVASYAGFNSYMAGVGVALAMIAALSL